MSHAIVASVIIAICGGCVVGWIWVRSFSKNECGGWPAVKNLKYNELDFGDIELKWETPDDRENPEYLIRVCSNHMEDDTHVTKNTSMIIRGLQPCIKYTVKVDENNNQDKYDQVNIPVKIRDVDIPVPENVKFNWETKLIEWTLRYKHCVQNIHLKVYHLNHCIKDVLLNEEATHYELTDLSTCSPYNISLQTISRKLSGSSVILKKIEPKIHINDSKLYVNSSGYTVLNSSEIQLSWSTVDLPPNCINEFSISVPELRIYLTIPVNQTTVNISSLKACMEYLITLVPLTLHRENLGRIKNIQVRTSSLEVGPVSDLKVVESKMLGSSLLFWKPPLNQLQCLSHYKITETDLFNTTYSSEQNSREAYSQDIHFTVNFLACVPRRFTVTPVNIDMHEGKEQSIEYISILEENEIRNLNFDEISDDLHVTWTSPTITSSCVEFYNLDICPLDSILPCKSYKPESNILGAPMGVIIPDIVACAIYKVSISVKKSNKMFEFHSEIYESKPRAHDTPKLVTILDLKATYVSFLWTLHDSDQNHCRIATTILECTTDGNSFMSYESAVPTRHNNTFNTDVTNMTPFTNYYCYLSFNQKQFKSGKSAAVNFVTLEDIPSPISNLTIIRTYPETASIKWKAPKQPNGILKMYQIHVRPIKPIYQIPSWCLPMYSGHMKKTFKYLIPANSTYQNITSLEPFGEYNVTVSASTSVGHGPLQHVTLITLPSKPGSVSREEYIQQGHSYTVLWRQPCKVNGILELFKVTVRGTRQGHIDDTFAYTVRSNTSLPEIEYSIKLPLLKPVYNYNVQIAAKVKDVDEFGEVKELKIDTPASIPPAPHYEQLMGKVKPEPVPGRNGTQFKIAMKSDIFKDDGGEILYYSIILARDVSLNREMQSGSWNVMQQWPHMINYEEALNYNFVYPYQVTPPYWNPFHGADKNDTVTYVIGEDVVCENPNNGYCNGPLKPDTKYCMKIRGFTAAGYQDSQPFRFTSGTETAGMIQSSYVSTICVVIFIIFIICGLYYVRTHQVPIDSQ